MRGKETLSWLHFSFPHEWLKKQTENKATMKLQGEEKKNPAAILKRKGNGNGRVENIYIEN